MVFHMSLFATELGSLADGRWGRLVRKWRIPLTRETNWEVLSALHLREIDRKLTPPTTTQEECQHVSVRSRGSQWHQSLLCRKCNMRLQYLPTVLAAAAAKVHRQRRTVALQQAGRLARTSRVARAMTAAQIREQAVRDVQEGAVEAAHQEVEASQQSGLLAIAEALNRLSEQNVLLHNQTQALMGRLITPAKSTPTEDRVQSESTEHDWTPAESAAFTAQSPRRSWLRVRGVHGSESAGSESAESAVTLFLEAQSQQSPQHSPQTPQRQSP